MLGGARTLPYRGAINDDQKYKGMRANDLGGAQPLLFAADKMSLNWGLDGSCIHAPVVNCLPRVWTSSRMNNAIRIKKINIYVSR